MTLAPIALFVYRRPDHTRRALDSLRACKELADSPLHIYCDAAKHPEADADVAATRRVARELSPAGTVFVEREHNVGLARSIIEGTTALTDRYGTVIVVEDDLEVAPSFLRFLNAGLARYAGDDRVMQISAYQFPLEPPVAARPLFMSFPTSWGWATWRRAWRHFDPDATAYSTVRDDRELRRAFDLDGSYPYFAMLERQRRGEIDSWAIRWHLSVFMRRGLVLYPGRSLVKNTGFDGSGTHGSRGAGFRDVIGDGDPLIELPDVALDRSAQQRVFAFLARAGARSPLARTLDVVAHWTKIVLASERVPRRARMLGQQLVDRVRAWRKEAS